MGLRFGLGLGLGLKLGLAGLDIGYVPAGPHAFLRLSGQFGPPQFMFHFFFFFFLVLRMPPLFLLGIGKTRKATLIRTYTCFWGGQWIFWGASGFSNSLAPPGQWLPQSNVKAWLGLVWCYGQGKFRVRVRIRVRVGP